MNPGNTEEREHTVPSNTLKWDEEKKEKLLCSIRKDLFEVVNLKDLFENALTGEYKDV